MALVFTYSTLVALLAALAVALAYLLLKAKKEIGRLKGEQMKLEHSIRSMNVKHGQHWENFVPFMPDFEKIARKENTVFIGMPVDLIAFDDDAIKFIEVKTGKSKLSDKQERIKRLVEGGKVKWHELRYEKK